MKIDKTERRILEALDECVEQKAVQETIAAIIPRIEKKLSSDPLSQMAWETIPIKLYRKLPKIIKSSWVFILRANGVTGAERHPNSQQRMVSYRGSGDFQTRTAGPWQSSFLKSDAALSLDERWISIPVNVWHQAVVSNSHWIVVSFHTVPAEQLIEERRDPADETSIRQKFYIESPVNS